MCGVPLKTQCYAELPIHLYITALPQVHCNWTKSRQRHFMYYYNKHMALCTQMPDIIRKFYWEVFKEVWKRMEFWNGKDVGTLSAKWWESIECKKKQLKKIKKFAQIWNLQMFCVSNCFCNYTAVMLFLRLLNKPKYCFCLSPPQKDK